MEKQSPHYDLAEIKAIVGRRGADAFTQTALRGIDDMALTYAEGIMVVLNEKTAYIKVTIHAGATVIQFKEK